MWSQTLSFLHSAAYCWVQVVWKAKPFPDHQGSQNFYIDLELIFFLGGRSFWVYCNPSTINNRALFGVRTCQPFSLGEMKPSSKDRWSCWDVIPIGGCFLNDQWEWPPLFDVLPRSIDTDNAYVLMQLIHKSFQYCSAQKNFANVDERSDRYGSQEFGGQMSAAVEALTTLTWIDYRVQFLDHFSSNTNEMSACL